MVNNYLYKHESSISSNFDFFWYYYENSLCVQLAVLFLGFRFFYVVELGNPFTLLLMPLSL